MSELKKNGIEFLSNLEGYHQCLKGIHWSTKCKAEHLLTDEIDDSVLDYEDSLAESIMGCAGVRYGVGELKTMMPSSRNLTDMLDEMLTDVNSFKSKLEDKKHAGIINILDDLITDINKWKYLDTFK